MNLFLLAYQGAKFTGYGRDAWDAKRRAAALLEVSPKAISIE